MIKVICDQSPIGIWNIDKIQSSVLWPTFPENVIKIFVNDSSYFVPSIQVNVGFLFSGQFNFIRSASVTITIVSSRFPETQSLRPKQQRKRRRRRKTPFKLGWTLSRTWFILAKKYKKIHFCSGLVGLMPTLSGAQCPLVDNINTTGSSSVGWSDLVRPVHSCGFSLNSIHQIIFKVTLLWPGFHKRRSPKQFLFMIKLSLLAKGSVPHR